LERIIFLTIILSLLGRYVVFDLITAPYAIQVDGRSVAFLSSKRAAERVIAEVKGGPDARFKEEVTIARGSLHDRAMSEPRAKQLLTRAATVMAEAWVIFIDGKPSIAVPSEEMAASVLNRARDRYGVMASNLMEVPTFKEDVKVQPAYVEAKSKIWTDIDAAVSELVGRPAARESAGRDRVHIVKSGDLASRIAQEYGLNLDQLRQLNPGINLDRLQIGDKLIVGSQTENAANQSEEKQAHPKLTVVVRDAVTLTETIPYRTEIVSSVRMRPGKRVILSPGRPGLRRIKRALIYENGVKTGSEIVEETILRQPMPERVAVGIGR